METVIAMIFGIIGLMSGAFIRNVEHEERVSEMKARIESLEIQLVCLRALARAQQHELISHQFQCPHPRPDPSALLN